LTPFSSLLRALSLSFLFFRARRIFYDNLLLCIPSFTFDPPRPQAKRSKAAHDLPLKRD
jgi:hypothetical protein